jgi:hypothetical protein
MAMILPEIDPLQEPFCLAGLLEVFDLETPPLLGGRGQDVATALSTTRPPAVPDVPCGGQGQHVGIAGSRLSSFKDSEVAHHGHGGHLGEGFLASLSGQVSEQRAGVPPDDGHEEEEPCVPGRNRTAASACFGGCHGTLS